MALAGALSPIKRVSAAVTERWRELRRGHRWLDHTATGYQHYQRHNGNQLAAAITYFSFLALFPLILLGVSVTAFVLASSPHLQDELFRNVTTQVPGSFGRTLTDAIHAAIRQRTAVGIVGLVGVALTGLGWIANLRTALDTIWDRTAGKQSFLAKKATDGLLLVGLGLSMLVSLGITAGGTAASHLVLRWVRIDGVTGAGTLTGILALLLAILGSMVIFGWVMIRLPDARVSRPTAIKVSLLAAIGFEILKVLGTYYIARVTRSPVAATIGPALGILVWINVVARYLLFCVAWAATAPDAARAPAPSEQPPATEPDRAPVPGFSPVAVAAGLLSAGATIGAATFAVLRGRYNRARVHQPPRS